MVAAFAVVITMILWALYSSSNQYLEQRQRRAKILVEEFELLQQLATEYRALSAQIDQSRAATNKDGQALLELVTKTMQLRSITPQQMVARKDDSIKVRLGQIPHSVAINWLLDLENHHSIELLRVSMLALDEPGVIALDVTLSW